MKKYWMICYMWRTRGSKGWRYANVAIDINPSDWILKAPEVVAEEEYVLMMAHEIDQAAFERLEGQF